MHFSVPLTTGAVLSELLQKSFTSVEHCATTGDRSQLQENRARAEKKALRDNWGQVFSAAGKIKPQLEAKRKGWHDNLKASSKLQDTIVKGKAAEEHECQELHHD